MDYLTNREISSLQCFKFSHGIKKINKMILMEIKIIMKGPVRRI